MGTTLSAEHGPDSGRPQDFNDLVRREANARTRYAEDQAFRAFYVRVGRALAEHHANTGVRIASPAWKIVVSPDLDAALTIYARRLGEKGTALEVSENGKRIAGIEVIADSDLKNDDVRLRAEIVA